MSTARFSRPRTSAKAKFVGMFNHGGAPQHAKSSIQRRKKRVRRIYRVPAEDIDLGLAVLSAITPPGVRRTLGEIAYCCGCKRGTIWMIESRALKKLKKKLFLRQDPVLWELMAQLGLSIR